MYPRALYVGLLALAVASLQFAATFGGRWHARIALLAALVLGAVVFYQGEQRLVPGPIFANFAAGVGLGTVASVVFTGALLMWFLNAPWDLAMWQGALFVWDVAAGIDFALVTSFFVVGVIDALY